MTCQLTPELLADLRRRAAVGKGATALELAACLMHLDALTLQVGQLCAVVDEAMAMVDLPKPKLGTPRRRRQLL